MEQEGERTFLPGLARARGQNGLARSATAAAAGATAARGAGVDVVAKKVVGFARARRPLQR